MLNKTLLLAQKQGLQDGEFLLTIGSKKPGTGWDGYYGFQSVGGYGSISPNTILYKGETHEFHQLSTDGSDGNGGASTLDFGIFGKTSATKVRITYKGNIIETDIAYDSKFGITAGWFESFNNSTVKFFFNDFRKNDGKTVPVRIELF